MIHTLQRNGKASIAVAAVAPGGVAIVASGSIKAISGMTILLIIAILPFLGVFVMMTNCEISADEPAVVEIQINGGGRNSVSYLHPRNHEYCLGFPLLRRSIGLPPPYGNNQITAVISANINTRHNIMVFGIVRNAIKDHVVYSGDFQFIRRQQSSLTFAHQNRSQ